MKKLTAFLMLLMCVSFAKMSAQSKLRWEVSLSTAVQISVNGVPVVNSATCNCQYGEIIVPIGATVYVFAHDTTGNPSAALFPVISEDDPIMIQYGLLSEYDFLNEEHTSMQEYFPMPELDMYVGINTVYNHN